MLAEDLDLAIAMRFGADPYAVNHLWPLELRARAAAYMAAEPVIAKKVKRRRRFKRGKK